MPRRLGRDTGLAPQLDGLVYPNRDRGDERQAQYSEPLPAGRRGGVSSTTVPR